MKKSAIVRTALVVALGFALCIAPALADSFTLHNKTSHEMTALYVSPSSKDSWGDNVLSGTVPAGEDATFTWSKDADDDCNWDVRGEYADGSYAEVKDVNFCQVSEVTFHD